MSCTCSIESNKVRVGDVGIVGVDASRIEDVMDDLCVGGGSSPYFMLAASHGPDETLQYAIFLAEPFSGELAGDAGVVEFQHLKRMATSPSSSHVRCHWPCLQN
jgi:hypothetical protein